MTPSLNHLISDFLRPAVANPAPRAVSNNDQNRIDALRAQIFNPAPPSLGVHTPTSILSNFLHEPNREITSHAPYLKFLYENSEVNGNPEGAFMPNTYPGIRRNVVQDIHEYKALLHNSELMEFCNREILCRDSTAPLSEHLKAYLQNCGYSLDFCNLILSNDGRQHFRKMYLLHCKLYRKNPIKKEQFIKEHTSKKVTQKYLDALHLSIFHPGYKHPFLIELDNYPLFNLNRDVKAYKTIMNSPHLIPIIENISKLKTYNYYYHSLVLEFNEEIKNHEGMEMLSRLLFSSDAGFNHLPKLLKYKSLINTTITSNSLPEPIPSDLINNYLDTLFLAIFYPYQENPFLTYFENSENFDVNRDIRAYKAIVKSPDLLSLLETIVSLKRLHVSSEHSIQEFKVRVKNNAEMSFLAKLFFANEEGFGHLPKLLGAAKLLESIRRNQLNQKQSPQNFAHEYLETLFLETFYPHEENPILDIIKNNPLVDLNRDLTDYKIITQSPHLLSQLEQIVSMKAMQITPFHFIHEFKEAVNDNYRRDMNFLLSLLFSEEGFKHLSKLLKTTKDQNPQKTPYEDVSFDSTIAQQDVILDEMPLPAEMLCSQETESLIEEADRWSALNEQNKQILINDDISNLRELIFN